MGADSALFSTLGIRILRGRPLSQDDRGAREHAVRVIERKQEGSVRREPETSALAHRPTTVEGNEHAFTLPHGKQRIDRAGIHIETAE